MLKSLSRFVVFSVFLWSMNLSASPMVQECAGVGEGCEVTCEAYCTSFGATPVVDYAGCGCPTIGTYANSCDCHCVGDYAVTTGLQIEQGDPQCHFYDYIEEQCNICPQ